MGDVLRLARRAQRKRILARGDSDRANAFIAITRRAS